MYIESIELIDFLPFELAGITQFRWTPTDLVQVVLGTNGSGKSHLLDELSPLPAKRYKFGPKGKKVVRVSHAGNRYELISDFSKGNKHWIIKNDTDDKDKINTGKMQTQLVKEIFNYDEKIHKLLSGKVLFSNMSPEARRELLMDICPVDYTYALSVYKGAATALRDVQGGIKLKEEELSAAKVELEELKSQLDGDRIEELNKLITDLYKDVSPYTVPLDKLNHEIDEQERRLEEIYAKFTNLEDINYTDAGYNSLEDMYRIHGSTLSAIKDLREKYNAYDKRRAEINDLLSDEEKELTIGDIDEKISELRYELTDIGSCPGDLVVEVDVGTSRLMELLDRIKECTTPQTIPTKEQLKTVPTELENLMGKRSLYQVRLKNLRDKLDNLQDPDHTANCPKCKVRFSLSVSGNLDELIDETRTAISKGEAAVKEVSEQIAELEYYQDCLNTIKATAHKVMPAIREVNIDGFAEYMGSALTIVGNLTAAENKVVRLINWIEANGKQMSVKREINKLNEIKTNIQNNGGLVVELGKVETKLHELELQLVNQEEGRDYLEFLINLNKTKQQYLDKAVLIGEELDKQYMDLAKSSVTLVAEKLQSGYIVELAALKSLAGNIAGKESIVESAESRLVVLRSRFKELQAITHHLSPKTGIIAEDMTGFINNVVDNVNNLVSSVWTYDMALEVQDLSKKLNYYFPARVPSGVLKDYNECSKGQKEMFDLAMMLVIRTYMGFDNYPIFLDETGANFDKIHTKKIPSLIKDLVADGSGQIFMVNHYASVHGSLTNCGFVVLSGDNIDKPSVYNTEVEIK